MLHVAKPVIGPCQPSHVLCLPFAHHCSNLPSTSRPPHLPLLAPHAAAARSVESHQPPIDASPCYRATWMHVRWAVGPLVSQPAICHPSTLAQHPVLRRNTALLQELKQNRWKIRACYTAGRLGSPTVRSPADGQGGEDAAAAAHSAQLPPPRSSPSASLCISITASSSSGSPTACSPPAGP